MKYLKCNNLPIYNNIFLATNYIPSKTSKTETRTRTKTKTKTEKRSKKQEATAHDHDRNILNFIKHQTLWNVECVGIWKRNNIRRNKMFNYV